MCGKAESEGWMRGPEADGMTLTIIPGPSALAATNEACSKYADLETRTRSPTRGQHRTGVFWRVGGRDDCLLPGLRRGGASARLSQASLQDCPSAVLITSISWLGRCRSAANRAFGTFRTVRSFNLVRTACPGVRRLTKSVSGLAGATPEWVAWPDASAGGHVSQALGPPPYPDFQMT